MSDPSLTPPPSPPLPPMVRLFAGGFIQGSPPTEPGREENDNEAEHPVQLTRGFWLGVYPITQDEYAAAMGAFPSHFPQGERSAADGRRPVEKVSWYDAVRFCNALSRAAGLPEAYTFTGAADAEYGERAVVWDRSSPGYRLPTEAEWEYAAGGHGVERPVDGAEPPRDTAWVGSQTQPVGQRAPNAAGLHDLCGNVLEWVWDVYAERYPDAAVDPVGPPSGEQRVQRGGAWDGKLSDLRVASRFRCAPWARCWSNGLRVARNAD